jgi:TolA-binding protein
VDANEMLKRRDNVISHLKEASDLCKKDSAWRSMQKPDTLIDSCDEGFHRSSLEIAAKWWEIWLKNKQNKDFSALTEKAFRIILDDEDPKKPDSKTRFAYAELLFQQGKYEDASREYKTVGEQTKDVKMSHDADYAALFAKEKSIEQSKTKDSVKEAERKALALNYLAKHPQGQYARSVQFKLGHIAYENGDYEEAHKRLGPLADSKVNDEFKKQSEDLLLDILNLKKDYAGIQKLSKQMMTRTADGSRKASLGKIYEEANFAEIQEFAKTGNKDQAAQKLSAFAKDHSDSKLAGEALWQSLSLFYSQGKTCDAADLSVRFAEKYPDDKRSPDAMKEAAKSYAECGDLSKSAETLMKVSNIDKKNKLVHLELAADMYVLEKRMLEARKVYNQIIADSDKKTLQKIYPKLMATYKDTDRNLDYEKLQNKILNQGIEPYATQILTHRAKALYDAGKMTQAFELAMKANSRDSAPEVRAEARLLQARILEKELASQSVKAREEKFALVLSMKTEKLDKAQTAYLTALKMAKDPFVQLEALRGIDRCYGNYVESLRAMPLPATLNAQDQAALRQEIAKIIAPIQDKKKDNEAKLKSLALTQSQGLSNERNFVGLGADKTVEPLVAYPPAAKLKPFYPDAKITKLGDVEKKGKELVRAKESRALGLYYLSLAAESRSNTDKSLWLIEQSLKMDATQAHYYYQKARLLYQLEGMASAKSFFDKVLDMQMTSTEMQTFAAVKSYSEGDFSTAATKFSGLKKEDLYTYEVGALYSESYAQKGETDKALSVIKDLLQSRKDNIDLLLEQAHLFEIYKADYPAAMAVYQKLQKLSKQEDLHDWLGRKINYLKNPNRVVQNVTSGD